MPRARVAVVALVAVAALVAIVLVPVAAPPDAPARSGIEWCVEPGRDMARRAAGVAGILPFRFVEAACSADQRAVGLAYESAVGSVWAYAVVGLPGPTSTGAASTGVVTIVGVSSEEWASSPDRFSTKLVEPCGVLPGASPGASAVPAPSS